MLYHQIMKKRKEPVPLTLKKLIQKSEGKKFKKIEFAEVDKVGEYKDEIAFFFKVLKIEAFVTDLSTLGDFEPDMSGWSALRDLSKKLGILFTTDDYVWEIGKKIREKNTEN